jgi:hypothetical protein
LVLLAPRILWADPNDGQRSSSTSRAYCSPLESGDSAKEIIYLTPLPLAVGLELADPRLQPLDLSLGHLRSPSASREE